MVEARVTTTGGRPGEGWPRRWAILATMLIGTTLAVLDSSILNISVVPVMEEFRADLRTVEWVLTSYNLAFAVFMIGLGSLGDTVGRRRLGAPLTTTVVTERKMTNGAEGEYDRQ
jgi:MFS family permease